MRGVRMRVCMSDITPVYAPYAWQYYALKQWYHIGVFDIFCKRTRHMLLLLLMFLRCYSSTFILYMQIEIAIYAWRLIAAATGDNYVVFCRP